MFYMPVKIYDEPDCVKRHAEELCRYGKKALIVTGRSSAFRNGSYDDVVSALKDNEREFVVFSEVEENPSVETVIKGRDCGLAGAVDFVIGIGGGSPLDAAKAIALLIRHPDWGEEELYGASSGEDALPVIAIPTTCGTGSEATGVSVLTRHSLRTKMSFPAKVFPRLALVDGKYLTAAPKEMIVNTAVDALAHLIESGLSAKSSPFSRMAVTEGLSVWKGFRGALTEPGSADRETLGSMMRASTLAGIAIAQTGTSLPHALSYILTYDQGIPHGRAVGYFLPAFLGKAPDTLRQWILKESGFESMDGFRGYLKEVLPPVKVSEETLERAFSIVFNNPAKMRSAAFPLDEGLLREVIMRK